jgi:hypothetical protein
MPRETHEYTIANVRLGNAGTTKCAVSVVQEDDIALVAATLISVGFERGIALAPAEAEGIAAALVDAAKKARAINKKAASK